MPTLSATDRERERIGILADRVLFVFFFFVFLEGVLAGWCRGRVLQYIGSGSEYPKFRNYRCCLGFSGTSALGKISLEPLTGW